MTPPTSSGFMISCLLRSVRIQLPAPSPGPPLTTWRAHHSRNTITQTRSFTNFPVWTSFSSAPPIARVITLNTWPIPLPRSYETHSMSGLQAMLRRRELNAEGRSADVMTASLRDIEPKSGSRSPGPVSCAGLL